MSMSHLRPDQRFDWHGFVFALKFLFFCAIAASFTHVGAQYVQGIAYASESKGPEVVVQRLRKYSGTLSTSTPQRIIRSLTAADVVPTTGKFIVADLSAMRVTLYDNGTSTAEFRIQTKGKPGTPWETPAGYYSVQTKEESHLSTIGHVYMPYSMQFYGNYFIHGTPYYPGGEPVSSTFSGGCIRLTTDDAAKVFAFADTGTGLFVYDPHATTILPAIQIAEKPAPKISAEIYLVADVDTGDVYLERDAQKQVPIASISKLITALVANETISFDKKIAVPETYVLPKNSRAGGEKKFVVGDLLYPLLMESSNGVADKLADYYGQEAFVHWMNTTARSLDMRSTHFSDPSGLSPGNISTSDDLFRLTAYLADKKTFIWGITRTPSKTLVASDGSAYPVANFNKFFDRPDFIGGKVGYTDEANHTMVSLFSFPVGGETRRVAFIVLQSKDFTADTKALVSWFSKASKSAGGADNAACASCAQPHSYRKIDL